MLKGKTLYVSDLDGTLLNGNQALSEFTVKALNSLIEKGMTFSYATARSYVTASKAVNGLASSMPVIVFNGTFITDSASGKRLSSEFFSRSEAERILRLLNENGVWPIVYSFINETEKYSFVPELASLGMNRFIETRNDSRRNPVDAQKLLDGDIFHFTCIDSPQRLRPMFKLLEKEFGCVYYKDIYTKEQWLEIHPKNATKAAAVLRLKEMLGCERVVCFGDAVNDIPMFRIADECYATENAVPELKAIATAVIDSNEGDGVAKWLLENFE